MIIVGLDIETTGFDPAKDQIIEIALIKFDQNGIQDSFQSLVRSGVPIPEYVSYITGIKNTNLIDAPILDDLKNKILQFIGDNPIFGHNISFDVNFLIGKGFQIQQNKLLDTLPIVSIAWPLERSFSLETLNAKFHVTHANKHRAYDDIVGNYHLFRHAEESLSKISPALLKNINLYLAKSDWSWKYLFQELKLQSPSKKFYSAQIQKSANKNMEISPIQDMIKSFLLKGGKLLVEAEKYNINDILAALLKSKTQTTISAERENYPFIDNRIAYIENPENHFCRNRFNKFLQNKHFTDIETSFLIKLLIWEEETNKGLKCEIPLQQDEKKLWNEVSYNSKTCAECSPNNCFYKKNLQDSWNKPILCVNHELLALMCKESNEKPYLFDRKVIIEGIEKFEENCQNCLTTIIDLKTFDDILEKSIESVKDKIKPKIEILFGLLGILLEKYEDPRNIYERELILTETVLLTKEWKNILASLSSIENALSELKGEIEDLQNKIKLIRTAFNDPSKNIIKIYINRSQQMKIVIIPKDTGDFLEKKVWSNMSDFVLLSRNIKTSSNLENSFDFIKKSLNLNMPIVSFYLPDKTKEIILETPQEIIESNLSSTQEALIEELALKSSSALAIICSSKTNVKNLWHLLAGALKKGEKNLLAPQYSGGFHKLIEVFLQNPDKSVIAATYDFFAKFTDEIISEFQKNPPRIKTMMIYNLSFDHPQNIIMREKTKTMKSPFIEYSVPRAILKLKSAINHFKDMGGEKIINLDSRLIHTEYGEEILKNLPSYVSF